MHQPAKHHTSLRFRHRTLVTGATIILFGFGCSGSISTADEPVDASQELRRLSMSVSPASPEPPNTSIQLSLPLQSRSTYRFQVRLEGSTSWSLLRDWGTESSVVWIPSAIGRYELLGEQRSKDGRIIGARSLYEIAESIVDTTAPIVAIVSPSSGSTYNTAQTLSLTAEASDNVGVARVEFWHNGILRGTDTSAPYTYAWAFSSTDNGAHSWSAKAFDATGNTASSSTTININISSGGTSSLPAPTGLTAKEAVVPCAVTMQWLAGTNSSGTEIQAFRIFRNGTFVKDVLPTTLTTVDSGLTGGSSYNYTVAAVDATGNLSPQSATAAGTASRCSPGSDTQAPTVPGDVKAEILNCKWARLSWTPSTDTGGSGLSHYEVDGISVVGPKVNAPASSIELPMNSGSTKTLVVSAVDNARNRTSSAFVTVTTPTCPADTTAPSTPSAFTAIATSCDTVTLSWNASIDSGSGISFYRLHHLGGMWYGSLSPNATSIKYEALPNRTYQFSLQAIDAAGNFGGKVTATAVTPVCTPTLATRMAQMAPQSTDLKTVEAGGQPKVIYAGSRWVMFWEKRERTCGFDSTKGTTTCIDGNNKLVASEIDAGGAPTAAHEIFDFVAQSGGPNNPGFLHLATHSGGFAVAWVQRISGGTNQVWYALIDASFKVTSIKHFDAPGGDWVSIAGGDSTLGITWDTNTPHQDNYFARVFADGTRGSAVLIADQSFSHEIDGELAWDGSQFGWLVESDREALARCACSTSYNGSPIELLLVRLSPTGARLGITNLSEGIEETTEFYSGASLVSRPNGGFTAVWISSSRGHDVVTAQVDASGAKMRNNVYLTSDGRASIESSPQIVRSATGYVAAYAYQPENYSDEAGLMAVPLDANGAPAGAGVRQVPKSPSCIGHSSTTQSSISYYPTNTDLTFCVAATKYKQGALPSLSAGPNGTSMIIWPSWAVGRYDLPTTSYGSYQGRVIFGAKLSF